MNENDLKHIIEATLLAAGRPVPTQQLIDLFDERERPTTEQVKHALDLLAADYAERGIEVIEVASGWRIQVRPRVSDVVSRLWQERPSRYSRALLETLALVAYRQPITRSEIEEIRGVAISSTIMRTLQERNWIRVVGHREVPGRPELLGTTREFLDYFGLKSLDQLPTLAELKDVETIGVQLELPAGEVPASADTADTAEGAQNTGADAQPATDANSTEAQSGAAEAESAAEAQSAGEAESGAEAESAVEAASVAGEEPAVEAESGAEAESAVEAASVAGEEPAVEAESGAEAESAVEAESVAEAESAVEAASAAEDESVVETEPAAEAESATELESSAAEPEVLADADEDNERDSETADDDESHASPTMVAASEEDRTEILEPVE